MRGVAQAQSSNRPGRPFHAPVRTQVCWFFGRDLAMNLKPPRPIGLVEAAVGGTSLQYWSSDVAIAQCQGHGESWDWPPNFRNGTGKLTNGYPLPDIPSGWNAKLVYSWLGLSLVLVAVVVVFAMRNGVCVCVCDGLRTPLCDVAAGYKLL